MGKRIETEEELRSFYPEVLGGAVKKVLSHLDKHARRFLELSPFCVISSCNRAGEADVSPRGDLPGFVRPLDERTLILPDRPGNNRLDSLSNFIENPAIGMWFLIPGLNDTLRVNGRAEVWVDEELNQLCAVNGKAALSVLKIHIEEIFFHCPKALMRSGLWDLGSHQDRSVMPPMRQIIRDQLELERLDLTEEEMNRGFRETLY